MLTYQYGLHALSIDEQEIDEPLLTLASTLTALNTGAVKPPLGPERSAYDTK
jgi:hypothetical protein